jgi:hypothetical protein
MNKEKEKLNRLINEAIQKGIPVSDNQKILEQSRKVDKLINEYQKQIRKRTEPSR